MSETAPFKKLPNTTSYRQFFLEHLILNEPAILDLNIDSWPCKIEWSTNNAFDIYKFCNKYKDLTAPVYDCSKVYHNSNVCEDVKIEDFQGVWVDDQDGSRYLKDWHLYQKVKESGGKFEKFYETPVYFQSDWLNEFYDSLGNDDYRVMQKGRISVKLGKRSQKIGVILKTFNFECF